MDKKYALEEKLEKKATIEANTEQEDSSESSTDSKDKKQEQNLSELKRKKYLQSQELLLAIDNYYIILLDKHQATMETRFNSNSELLIVPTRKQTYVVDKETMKMVEYDYWMQMCALIREKYSKLIKGNCNNCNGSGRSHFNQSAPGDMLIPVICKCVVKNYNKKIDLQIDHKDNFDLLHAILEIPQIIENSIVETPEQTIKRVSAEVSGEAK